MPKGLNSLEFPLLQGGELHGHLKANPKEQFHTHVGDHFEPLEAAFLASDAHFSKKAEQSNIIPLILVKGLPILLSGRLISTPVAAQTQSETLAIKGLAYAVPSLRVDGNDVLAMYAAIKSAVDKARAGGGPTFIEAVTYRLGAHSSADDPTHYRDGDEHKAWQRRDPLLRFAAWLESQKILSTEAQAVMRTRLTDAIRAAIVSEEAAGPPPPASLFEDVVAKPTWLLEEQKAGLLHSKG